MKRLEPCNMEQLNNNFKKLNLRSVNIKKQTKEKVKKYKKYYNM